MFRSGVVMTALHHDATAPGGGSVRACCSAAATGAAATPCICWRRAQPNPAEMRKTAPLTSALSKLHGSGGALKCERTYIRKRDFERRSDASEILRRTVREPMAD